MLHACELVAAVAVVVAVAAVAAALAVATVAAVAAALALATVAAATVVAILAVDISTAAIVFGTAADFFLQIQPSLPFILLVLMLLPLL